MLTCMKHKPLSHRSIYSQCFLTLSTLPTQLDNRGTIIGNLIIYDQKQKLKIIRRKQPFNHDLHKTKVNRDICREYTKDYLLPSRLQNNNRGDSESLKASIGLKNTQN